MKGLYMYRYKYVKKSQEFSYDKVEADIVRKFSEDKIRCSAVFDGKEKRADFCPDTMLDVTCDFFEEEGLVFYTFSLYLNEEKALNKINKWIGSVSDNALEIAYGVINRITTFRDKYNNKEIDKYCLGRSEGHSQDIAILSKEFGINFES